MFEVFLNICKCTQRANIETYEQAQKLGFIDQNCVNMLADF